MSDDPCRLRHDEDTHVGIVGKFEVQSELGESTNSSFAFCDGEPYACF